ncbi:hypothetical protein [Acidovorax sp. SUPP2825]|uniref:hypothetical protein n=1 Tax=Acidovorax sp. SUPP2825 TaxID=2920879 RepID=UPI0032E9CF4B
MRRLILTASGGPSRDRIRAHIAQATISEVLKHPTWQMGHKNSLAAPHLRTRDWSSSRLATFSTCRRAGRCFH